jgi:SAM-dependent methyltransferase
MPPPNIDSAGEKYSQFRQDYWEANAETLGSSRSWGQYYHRRLIDIYRHQVLPHQRVVEFGCGQGDLLAGVSPSYGLGIDFSAGMIRRARQRHPELNFIQADVDALPLNLANEQPFDVIIISDLLNELWDVQRVFEQAGSLAGAHTRLIVNSYSRLWEVPLGIAQHLKVASPILHSNWLTWEDISNLAHLADFELIRHWSEFLFPLPIPGIAWLCNRYVVKFWPFNLLALTNFLVFRPKPPPVSQAYSVSVIVPTRNEAGNIAEIFRRTPEMGSWSELIFVEGHSSDNTWPAIQQQMALEPARPCQLLRQEGAGKGDAVRLGFTRAQGDILMILDADLTVPPEDLPRFYTALSAGKGEFINGVRLVYPMEKQAMRFLNFLGNKFFSVAFSWLIGQPIKDTLCGTKVLWRRDYQRSAANRAYFGDFDPFGDFDLIFGAVRLNRKIVDLPVRYRERVYGTTNIRRWKHGWLLLKMLYTAARRLKFV